MSDLFTAHRGFALIDQTPAHVQADLLGERVDETSDVMDLGSIVHGCLLTGDANVELIAAPDWRTKVAKEARDAARLAGKTPLLAHKWDEVQAMVQAARRQLERHELPTPFVGGYAEQSLFFTLDGVECRCTPDWVSTDRHHVVEYKTTGVSAHPAAFAKSVWSNGYAFQAALERLAVATTYGLVLGDVDHRWIAQETYPPYALSAVSLDPEGWLLAHQQVTEALRLWKDCRARNEWPGYPARTMYTDCPPYVQAQWLERRALADVSPR